MVIYYTDGAGARGPPPPCGACPTIGNKSRDGGEGAPGDHPIRRGLLPRPRRISRPRIAASLISSVYQNLERTLVPVKVFLKYR